MHIGMTEFAERQYRSDFSGTVVRPEWVADMIERAQRAPHVLPGYADFCKIVVLPNEPEHYPLRLRVIERQAAAEQGADFHTAYEARRPEELAVLTEWVSGVEGAIAPWIHLIVYSREQLEAENEPVDADWGIVSVNAGATSEPEPMRPITMMRNALGIEFGGSGHPIDPAAYDASVRYWSQHVLIRAE